MARVHARAKSDTASKGLMDSSKGSRCGARDECPARELPRLRHGLPPVCSVNFTLNRADFKERSTVTMPANTIAAVKPRVYWRGADYLESLICNALRQKLFEPTGLAQEFKIL